MMNISRITLIMACMAGMFWLLCWPEGAQAQTEELVLMEEQQRVLLRKGHKALVPSEEMAFARVKFTSDVDGILWLDFVSQPIKAGKPLLFSIPKSFTWRFVDTDSFFITPENTITLSPDQKGSEVLKDIRLAKVHKDLSRRYARQLGIYKLLRQIDKDMVPQSGNKQKGGPMAPFEISRHELRVSQYRLYHELEVIPEEQGEGPTSLVTVTSIRATEPSQFNINFQYRPDANLRTYDEEDHPAVFLTRTEAEAFCKWLSENDTRFTYRLPSQAEWLHAAFEGGDENGFPSKVVKENWASYANLADQSLGVFFPDKSKGIDRNRNDGFSFTAPVGSMKDDGSQLYDMLGNVAEWVSDDIALFKRETEPRGLAMGGSFFSSIEDLSLNLSETVEISIRYSRIGARLLRETKVESQD